MLLHTRNKDRFILLGVTSFAGDVPLKEVVEVDTETTGFDFIDDRVFSLQLSTKHGPLIIDCDSAPIEEWLPKLQGRKLIFHNAKFDLPFLMKKGFFPHPRNVVDTMIQETCLTLGTGYKVNLGDTAKRRVGAYIPKDRQKTIMHGFRHPLDLDYAWKDVEHLTDIHNAQTKEAKRTKQERNLSINSAFVTVLAYTEWCGIKLDKAMWKQKMAHDKELELEALRTLNKFCKDNKISGTISDQVDLFSNECEVGVNWNSPPQVLKIFQGQGIPTEYKKKQTVSAKLMERHKRDFELVRRYLYYKQRAKDCSTYGNKFLNAVRADGRIHTSFKQLVSTGRMSCGRKAREKGQLDLPNLQNIPKVDGKHVKAVEARYCFVPEPGNVFIVADYASQESRILADKTKDKGLLDFYLTGGADLHSYTAQKVWPETIGILTLDEVKEKFPEKRDTAKKVNFAIAYGGNGHTIADNADIPVDEGEQIYEAYLKAFPGVADFFEVNLTRTLTDGYITINEKVGARTFPRHNPFSQDEDDDIQEEDESVYTNSQPAVEFYKKLAHEVEAEGFQKRMKRKGLPREEREEMFQKFREYNRLKSKLTRLSTNYLIQGTAALQTKVAGILFYIYLYERNLLGTVKVVNIIHDEYVVECPKEMAEEIKVALVDCMVKGGDYFMDIIPMAADAHIDTKWSK